MRWDQKVSPKAKEGRSSQTIWSSPPCLLEHKQGPEQTRVIPPSGRGRMRQRQAADPNLLPGSLFLVYTRAQTALPVYQSSLDSRSHSGPHSCGHEFILDSSCSYTPHNIPLSKKANSTAWCSQDVTTALFLKITIELLPHENREGRWLTQL